MASLTITFVGLVILLKICRPLNVYRGVLSTSMILGTMLALLILPSAFLGYVNLTLSGKLFIALITFISFFVLFLPLILTKNNK